MKIRKDSFLSHHRRTRVRAAVFWSTVVGLLFVISAPAPAGEIDDLKAQVQILMQRIEKIDAKQKKMEAQQASAPVPAKGVSSGNKNISLEVSGQVNRAALMVDDGDRTKFFHVDNDNSSTLSFSWARAGLMRTSRLELWSRFNSNRIPPPTSISIRTEWSAPTASPSVI